MRSTDGSRLSRASSTTASASSLVALASWVAGWRSTALATTARNASGEAWLRASWRIGSLPGSMFNGSWVGPGSTGAVVRGSVAAGAMFGTCRRLEGGPETGEDGVGAMCEGSGAGGGPGI